MKRRISRIAILLVTILLLRLTAARDATQAVREINVRAPVRSLLFSPDGRTLAISAYLMGGGNDTFLWDSSTNVKPVHLGKGSVWRFLSGQRLATSTSEAWNVALTTWDIQMRNKVQVRELHPLIAYDYFFWPDEFTLCHIEEQKLIGMDIKSGKHKFALPVPGLKPYKWLDRVSGVSPDGRLLWVVDRTGNTGLRQTEIEPFYHKGLRFWSLPGPKSLRALDTKGAYLMSLGFSSNGKFMVKGNEKGAMEIWSTLPLQRQRTIQASDLRLKNGRRVFDYAENVVLSPDGALLAAATSKSKIVGVWNTHSGRLLRTISDHSDNIYALAFAPDGRTLAIGDNSGSITLRRVR